jgi:hypothetical protein
MTRNFRPLVVTVPRLTPHMAKHPLRHDAAKALENRAPSRKRNAHRSDPLHNSTLVNNFT